MAKMRFVKIKCCKECPHAYIDAFTEAKDECSKVKKPIYNLNYFRRDCPLLKVEDIHEMSIV